MDRTNFLDLMATAQLAYGNKLGKETVEVYWKNLQFVEYQAAANLLEKHIQSERFFPRISDLRPMADHRPQLGPRYINPPETSEYVKQANKVLLGLILSAGGVLPSTLKVLTECKNAAVEDAEAVPPGHAEFAAELSSLLRGLLNGHEGRAI